MDFCPSEFLCLAMRLLQGPRSSERKPKYRRDPPPPSPQTIKEETLYIYKLALNILLLNILHIFFDCLFVFP